MNLQVNVLQAVDIARQSTAMQDVGAHQKMAQEASLAKESQTAPKQVQNPNDAQKPQLSKDGSGHGRAFLRHPRTGGKPEEPEEPEQTCDPGKGDHVDFTR